MEYIAHAQVSKELRPFTGGDASYRTWANRIKDHFREVNADWAYAFAEMEKRTICMGRGPPLALFLGLLGVVGPEVEL